MKFVVNYGISKAGPKPKSKRVHRNHQNVPFAAANERALITFIKGWVKLHHRGWTLEGWSVLKRIGLPDEFTLLQNALKMDLTALHLDLNYGNEGVEMPDILTKLLRLLPVHEEYVHNGKAVSLWQLLEAVVDKLEEPYRLKEQRNRLRAELETLERDMKAKNILV